MSGPQISSSRVRLFKNDSVEKLTVISPAAFAWTWSLALPLIAFAGWGKAEVSTALALMLAGLVVWSLFEYAMHRYLFHWSRDWRPLKWFVFLIHGNHHAAPGDRMRNLMPVIASWPIGGCVWAIAWLALGHAGTWLFLGFMIGYVAYDTVHFACHQLPMKSRIGMALKQHHMRHHHVDENRNYAITALFWDSVFGTKITSLSR